MACRTVTAKASTVDIVACVTPDAAQRQGLAGSRRAPVAGFTVDIRVRAGQRKPRLPIVVEQPERPAIGVVARGAVRAQATLVDILVHMAGRTARVRHLVALITVTGLAGQYAMLADQRE